MEKKYFFFDIDGTLAPSGSMQLSPATEDTLRRLTDLMNAAALSLQVLGLQADFEQKKPMFCAALVDLLQQHN